MFEFAGESRHLPYLCLSEHILPQRKLVLRSQPLSIASLIRQAEDLGGLWLGMQDIDGSCAIAPGNIVSLAEVERFDFFAEGGVELELNICGWGEVEQVIKGSYPLQLLACQRNAWPATSDELKHLPLEQLRSTLIKCQSPNAITFETKQLEDPAWLSWRWLEVLPLPLQQKQQLLSYESPTACLNYVEQLLQKSLSNK